MMIGKQAMTSEVTDMISSVYEKVRNLRMSEEEHPQLALGIDHLVVEFVEWKKDDKHRFYLKLKATRQFYGRYKNLYNFGWIDLTTGETHLKGAIRYHFSNGFTKAVEVFLFELGLLSRDPDFAVPLLKFDY